MRGELKCAGMKSGNLFVMTHGDQWMQRLYAGNLGTSLVVRISKLSVTSVLIWNLTGAVAYRSAHFGEGEGVIGMDDVQCVGSESNLLECSHTKDHNCGHYEDAGVTCAQGMIKGL